MAPRGPYRDQKQVELDVSRLNLNKAAAAQLNKRIGQILRPHKQLHYYQGFHDIAQHTRTTKQLEQLAFCHLRDFMASDFTPTTQMLQLIPELLARADPDGLGRSLGDSPMLAQGLFALSPLITLFSHTCTDPVLVTRVINRVSKQGMAYVVYLYVALCVAQRDALLARAADSDELFSALNSVGESLTVDNVGALEHAARQLREQHPLQTLDAYARVSQYSVLKTGVLTNTNTVMYSVEQIGRQDDRVKTKLLRGSGVLMLTACIVAASIVYSRIRSRS